MGVALEIVAGFLGAGKTTVINQMLKSYLANGHKVLVIQGERGEKNIDQQAYQNTGRLVVKTAKVKDLDPLQLVRWLEEHKPDNLIIENNGMEELEPLLKKLEQRPLRKYCRLQRIISLVKAGTFNLYAANIGRLFGEPLSKADMVILTATEGLPAKDLRQIQKEILKFNGDAAFLLLPSAAKAEKQFPEESFSAGGKRGLFSTADPLVSFALLYAILLVFGFIVTLRVFDYARGELYLARAQIFITIFVSILLQAFPFIMIGVLVSAAIQVFVPQQFFSRLFSRNVVFSTAIAVMAGIFFPVCDCAIIPVMRRLVQKGVPLSAALTFMLAAPIVDPVVVASTAYAFPDKPFIALYRLSLGVFIAIIAGLIMRIIPYKGEILKGGAVFSACSCGYCSQADSTRADPHPFTARIKGMINHATAEFFQVGQFLVLAAVFSTYIQTSISPATVAFFAGSPVGALLTMMGFAFILSICSTSDAFIARNFIHQFPLTSILGFMVFGAFLDIKNLLLLSGNFAGRFVVHLVLLIVTVSFIVLSLSGKMLFF